MAPRAFSGTLFSLLITSVIALVTLTALTWIGQTSTWHRDAADDLMHQLVRSMDTQLLASLQSSIKMVKEAHNMWSFTGAYMHHCSVFLSRPLGFVGAPASSLSSMNVWSTELMEDYYLSTKLSMLRYGTTSGLEQSVNTTTDGVRVLSRNFYGSADTACLRSYYTDGTTTDGTADNCHSDPRYTDWYETSLGSTKDGSDYPAVIPCICKPR